MIINSEMKNFVNENNSVYEIFRGLKNTNQNIIDLTLGNPIIKPPQSYYDSLSQFLDTAHEYDNNMHGYTTDHDSLKLREKIATRIIRKHSIPCDHEQIINTVGSTNAFNIALKSIIRVPNSLRDNLHTSFAKSLTPSSDIEQKETHSDFSVDEVIVFSPYFPEYTHLVKRNFAKPVIVPTDKHFQIDIDILNSAISENTRAIIINSPNNPSGRIVSKHVLKNIAQLLMEKSLRYNRAIWVIEDAVYDDIVFSQDQIHSMLSYYPYTFHLNSFSKSYGIAGERLGYICVTQAMREESILMEAIKLNVRASVVNAPCLQQRIFSEMNIEYGVDSSHYANMANRLLSTLQQTGFNTFPTEGGFYIWTQIPKVFSNEREFRQVAFSGDNALLYLPGIMFGGDQYERFVRFSVSTSEETIEAACKKLETMLGCRGALNEELAFN